MILKKAAVKGAMQCLYWLVKAYGEAQIVDIEEVLSEWQNLRLFKMNECSSKTKKEMLKMLAKEGSTLALSHPNLAVLAQI